MNPQPSLHDLLSADEAAGIVRQAIRVLEEVGVECDHRQTQEALRETTATKVDRGRLHFAPDDVEKFLSHIRRTPLPTEVGERFIRRGQWNCLYLCEPLTHQIRAATEQEIIDMAHLAEQLGKQSGPVPLAPHYVPPVRRTLECERLGLLHTQYCGGIITAIDRQEVRFLAEMNQAAGRRYVLGIEGLISPLRINSVVMNVYFENRDDPDVDLAPMTTIPMAVLTTSLVQPAGIVQSVAESIVWDFIVHHLSGGKLRCINLRLEPFDLRDANIAIGTPEWCLFRQLTLAMSGYLAGSPFVGGYLRSNSRWPDYQAQVQRTASVVWQALLGVRQFGAVGQLCMDEVFSPVQAIYDREIVGYAERLALGIGPFWDESRDPVEAIREGLERDTFLDADDTVARCRSAYWYSDLFDAKNLGAWKAGGMKDKEQQAWEEAQRLIGDYQFELPADAKKDVQKIYDRAVKRLG